MKTRALAAVAAVLLVLVVGVGLLYSVMMQTVLVSPSAVPILSTATPAASVSASPAVASPASGLVTYQDLFLGFRISLPVTYRPSASKVLAGQDELGWDSYTLLTAAEERAECLRPKGDIPSPAQAAYLYVHASRNVDGMTAVQWVNTPRCAGCQAVSHFQTVVPLTLDGREAVKLVAVATGETTAYVIRADDRMYLLTPTQWPTQHRLDDIAATFKVIALQASPVPTSRPSASPACP